MHLFVRFHVSGKSSEVSVRRSAVRQQPSKLRESFFKFEKVGLDR